MVDNTIGSAAGRAESQVLRALAQPREDLLSKIRSTAWTSHNIPLTRDESTLGPNVPLIGDDRRTVLIRSLIRTFLHSDRPLRILDLGALEGGLSFEMARDGHLVTGIEARTENFEKAEQIRGYFSLPNLDFQLRDVKTLNRDEDGFYDVILCCGLLYHLDDPFTFLETLASLLRDDGLLFLDTHVAPDPAAEAHATYSHALSATVTVTHGHHQYEGRWFMEPREGTPLDAVWSAVSNERSFWPSRRSLIRAASHSGLIAIHELFGAFDIDVEFALREQFSRLYLACRKQW